MKERTRRIEVKALVQYMRRYIKTRATGLLELLDSIAKRRYSQTAIELLFTEPQYLLDIIIEHYSSREVALFVISKLFIRPLAIRLNILEHEDRLLEALANNPHEFLALLREHGVELEDTSHIHAKTRSPRA